MRTEQTATESPERPTVKGLCRKLGVTLRVTGEALLPWDRRDDWQKQATGYRVQLRYARRAMSLDFWQGSAHTDDPTVSDVLSCLLSDSMAVDQAFEDWCGDLGYDTDSRKAESTYRACVRSGEALQRVLGDQYETFLYAEQD
jgi:hypothetical protein